MAPRSTAARLVNRPRVKLARRRVAARARPRGIVVLDVTRLTGCLDRARHRGRVAFGAAEGRVTRVREVELPRARRRPHRERDGGRLAIRRGELARLMAAFAGTPHSGIAVMARRALPRRALQASVLVGRRVTRRAAHRFVPLMLEPGGVALLIQSMTDNRNRTVAEIRHLFSKNGGNLGESGSVGWMFEKKGYIVVDKAAKSEEELFELAIDAGADDLRDDGDTFEILTSPDAFEGVLAAVKATGIEPQAAEVEMVPQNYIRLEGADARQMLKLMEALEDHDDVQKVSANFDISEADMAAV